MSSDELRFHEVNNKANLDAAIEASNQTTTKAPEPTTPVSTKSLGIKELGGRMGWTPREITYKQVKAQTDGGATMTVSDWNKLPAPQAAQAPPKWVPQDNDSVAEIQTSDGQSHLIHGDDLAEAQRRDPSLKVMSQPQTYRDYARGRTLENMTRAMSGQPMARPEDQAEAERGKRAGTIAGGIAIGTGALGGCSHPACK